MNTFGSWGDATVTSLQNAWFRVVNALPNLLVAIVIFIVGYLVAKLVGSIVRKLCETARMDSFWSRSRIHEQLEKNGHDVSLSAFIGGIARWVVILVTLSAVADALRWTVLTTFLHAVVAYIPNVLVALAIVVVGFVAARFLHDLTEGAVEGTGMGDTTAKMVAGLVEGAVVVFAFMASLTQLNIAADLIRILFTGIVAALAISVGLAFGLGGRDKASHLLDGLGEQMNRRSEGGGGIARARAEGQK